MYAQAVPRAKQGERSMSLDDLTGVQAIERKHPDLPMQPGHVLRREFEYLRHGTLSWFINVDVVTGHVIEPSWGPTRTEEEALAHLQRLIGSSPQATKWHVILDNLNIHQSEALVRWVAEREGIAAGTLGIKGKSGILQSVESRAAVFTRPKPPGGIVLDTQACFLDESRRNLAEYSRPHGAQARQFLLAGRLARPHPGVHRLLQSYDGQTHQVDVHRADLIMEPFLPQCTSGLQTHG